MPSTYSTRLRLELQATGENRSTWGTKTNNTLEMIEAAISGYVSVAMADANTTLSTANGTTDEARNMIVQVTGAHTAIRTLTVPSVSKLYLLKNATTGGYAVSVKTAAGTAVTVPASSTRVIFCDGTDCYLAQTTLSVSEGGTGATDAATARTNLGLGTVSTYNTGTSGTTVPLLDGTNTWSGVQTMARCAITDASNGVYRTVDNSVLNIFGGPGAGANIELFGSTHATNASEAYYDAASHNFRSVAAGVVTMTNGGNPIWHGGNDGAGSGLDADLLDGQQGSYYTNATNINFGTLADARLPSSMAGKTFTSSISMTGVNNGLELGPPGTSNTPFIDFHSSANVNDFDARIIASGGTAGTGGGTIEFTCTTLTKGGNTIWHAGNDGAGSGLDADLLDGMTPTEFATANTIASRNVNGDTLFRAIVAQIIEYTSTLQITYNGTENFRFRDTALLSNGMTANKTAIGDAGTGLAIEKAGLLWISRDGAAPMLVNRDTSDGISIQFGRSKSAVGSISVTTTATAYNTSSDGRAKINRAPLANQGAIIDALNPITYSWSHVPGATGVGFVAQDLQQIIPEVVTAGDSNPALQPGDDGFEWWSVDMSKIVPYLVAEIKELRARVAALEGV